MSKVIEVKCISPFFEEVKAGNKPFEIRYNDRDYQTGDILVQRHWVPESGYSSEKPIRNKIGFLTNYEQKSGYVVFGLLD